MGVSSVLVRVIGGGESEKDLKGMKGFLDFSLHAATAFATACTACFLPVEAMHFYSDSYTRSDYTPVFSGSSN